MSDELKNTPETPEEITKNLMLLLEAAIKIECGEFKSVEEVHSWLYANGYTTTEEHRIQSLHQVEQLDAELKNIINKDSSQKDVLQC